MHVSPCSARTSRRGTVGAASIVGSGLGQGRPETEDLRPNPARRYNRGVPLDPELLDELRAAVGSEGDEELTIARWDAFHKSWLDASRMEAHRMALS